MEHKNVWEILKKERYTEKGVKEMERLYDTLSRIMRNLGNEETRGLYCALDSNSSEILWILEDIIYGDSRKEKDVWDIITREKYNKQGIKYLEEIYDNLINVAKKIDREDFEELYKAVNTNLSETLWILKTMVEYWFGKGCEWQLIEPDKVENAYCCIQQGGSRDFEGNCSIEFCPLAREELKITKPNTHCPICDKPLNIYNVSRNEWSDDLRPDSLGRVWCIKCTEEHDSIDWAEVHEKRHNHCF